MNVPAETSKPNPFWRGDFEEKLYRTGTVISVQKYNLRTIDQDWLIEGQSVDEVRRNAEDGGEETTGGWGAEDDAV